MEKINSINKYLNKHFVLCSVVLLSPGLFINLAYSANYAENICTAFEGQSKCLPPLNPKVKSNFFYTLRAGDWGTIYGTGTTPQQAADGYGVIAGPMPPYLCSSCNIFGSGSASSPLLGRSPSTFWSSARDIYSFANFEGYLPKTLIIPVKNSSGDWLGNANIAGEREIISFRCPSNTTQVMAFDPNRVKYPFMCQLPPEPKRCNTSNNNNPIPSTCGNPIDYVSGNKMQKESDWYSPFSPLNISRIYNSLPENQYLKAEGFKHNTNWDFNFDKQIVLQFNKLNDGNLIETYQGSATILFDKIDTQYAWQQQPTPFYPIIRLKRPGGNTYIAYVDSVITANDESVSKIIFKTDQRNNGIKIEAFPDGSWLYSNKLTGIYEIYNKNGQLIREKYLNGQSINFTYDNNYLLHKITDNFGHTVHFSYDTEQRIDSIQLGNLQLKYSYDAKNRLVSVKKLGSIHATTRYYHYSENSILAPSGNSNLLTGITDEKGNRFATYAYDNTDRAISTEHSNGADKHTVDYSGESQGQREVTAASGKVFTYNLQNIQGYNTPTLISDNRLSETKLSFDQFGNVSSILKNGKTTKFIYDPELNREISRTEAVGTAQERTVNTTWHSYFSRPIQIQEIAQGQVIRSTDYTYDNKGNVLTKTITDPASQEARSWAYEYNSFSQLTKETNPQGKITTYQYDGDNGNLLSSTDTNGIITTYSQHNAQGQPLIITTSSGQNINLVYDDIGRVIQQKQTLTNDELQKQISEDGLNWWQQLVNAVYSLFNEEQPYTEEEQKFIVVANPGVAQQAINSYEYDPRGLLTSTTLPDGERIEYTYDDAHRLTEVKDQSGNRTIFILNSNGDITQTTVYGNTGQLEAKNQQVYDSIGRLQQTLGNQQQKQVLTYNNNDQVTSENNALNQSYFYAYDVLDRQISKTDPLDQSNQYEYNALDQLKKVIDAKGGATTYQYNAFGEVTQLNSPDTGITSYQYQNGKLLEKVDANQRKHRYQYDAQGQVTLQQDQYTDGTEQYENTSFAYGQIGNDQGRLVQANNKRAETTFSYNNLGLVRRKTIKYLTTQQSTAPQLNVYYSYSLGGKLKQLGLPSGNVVNYDYDNKGQLTGIKLNSQNFINNIQHSVNGIKGWTYSQVGDQTQFQYDLDGRITKILIPNAYEKDYSYDAADRILTITDQTNSNNNSSFNHDALSRLIKQNLVNKTFKYSYDANSNRLTRNQIESGTSIIENYTIQTGNNRIRSITQGTNDKAYTYLPTGQITNDGLRSYTYNTQGRSESISAGISSSFNAYDAFGQRIQKIGSNAGTQTQTLFVYDENGQLLGEYTPQGEVIREYIWLENRLVGLRSYQYPNEILRVHTDHLGTPRAISTNSNQVVWRWEGDQFGDVLPTGNLIFPIRHAGQYYDSETGIFYNYFRDYDSVTGRYIESDPIGLNGGLNTYGYVGGNSLHLTDSSGLFPDSVSMTCARNPAFCAEVGIIAATAPTLMSPPKPIPNNPAKDESCEKKCLPANESTIRSVLTGDRHLTLQKSVSLPVIQAYVARVESGQRSIPPIKADGNIIVDGNHRYIVGKLCSINVSKLPSNASHGLQRFPMSQIKVDGYDWGNR
ncbi:RHS repeat-associated core domain-containing protein [Acinetobacter sp. G11]|uniref:RHS repeat-associated core domain-containing protein n=1 Tax=Acinetobacter sp. G11 TaxID=3415989 RepID=UPI003C7BB9CA